MLQFSKMWTMSKHGARLETLNRRKRQKEYNIGKAREIRWAGPTSLFNCGTWFRTGAFNQQTPLAVSTWSFSNLQQGCPSFPSTKQLMSCNFVYSRDMVLNRCIQIWFLCRQSNLEHTRESGFMDTTLKWILCQVNNEDLAPGPHIPCVYEINSCLWVCKYVCACWSVHAYMKALFRFQAGGTRGND